MLVFRIRQRITWRGRHVRLRANVTERLETLARVGRHLRGRLNRCAADQTGQRAAERLRRLRTIGGDILPLVRIAIEVVELLPRRLDEPEAAVGQRRQLAPPEVIARIQRFRIHGLLRELPRALDERPQGPSAEVSGKRRLHKIQNRGHDVDVLHDVADPASRAGVAGRLDDQRNVNRFVVEKQAVLLLPVIPEAFAVIGEQDDGGAVVQLVRLQVLNQTADDFVAVGDLAVVWRVLREALGRRVRFVRLVEVQKQKRARRALRIEPVLGHFFRFAAIALDLPDAQFRRRRRHVAVEEIKTLRDAGFLPQHVRRDDAARREAAVVEHLRQHALARLHDEADVIAHTGLERQPPGEERRVRRQRLWRVRIRVIEHDAVGGKRVDCRRLDLGVAVDRQVIGAQRVDRDQDDRSADWRGRPRVAPAADRREGSARRGQNKDEGVSKRTGHKRLPTHLRPYRSI